MTNDLIDSKDDPLAPAKEQYLDNTTWWMKILRFFNLLEPGIAVISISKLLCWIMAVFVIYTFVYHPANFIMILSAVGSFTGSMMNYGYRRWMFSRTGKTN